MDFADDKEPADNQKYLHTQVFSYIIEAISPRYRHLGDDLPQYDGNKLFERVKEELIRTDMNERLHVTTLWADMKWEDNESVEAFFKRLFEIELRKRELEKNFSSRDTLVRVLSLLPKRFESYKMVFEMVEEPTTSTVLNLKKKLENAERTSLQESKSNRGKATAGAAFTMEGKGGKPQGTPRKILFC